MIQTFSNWLTFTILSLDPASKIGSSINFFVYDTLKIYLLIFIVLTVVGFLRTYLSPETIRRILGKQRFGVGNVVSASVGAVTPFCSCSSIPLFIGFIESGVPLGIAFSFLIASPLVNEVVFVLMGGLFGWKIAALYALAGISLGVLSGIIIGKLGMEKEVVLNGGMKSETLDLSYLPKSFEGKMQFALREGVTTFRKLWWVILIGVGLGAVIHGYVPQDLFEKYLGTGSWSSVPMAVLIGIPIYAGCSSLVPVIFAFVLKGVPLGTALAFLMAVAGLSLPEGIMLRRVISTKLLAVFFSTVGVGIIIIGYLFNALFSR